jgi:hypothetical protein
MARARKPVALPIQYQQAGFASLRGETGFITVITDDELLGPALLASEINAAGMVAASRRGAKSPSNRPPLWMRHAAMARAINGENPAGEGVKLSKGQGSRAVKVALAFLEKWHRAHPNKHGKFRAPAKDTAAEAVGTLIAIGRTFK